MKKSLMILTTVALLGGCTALEKNYEADKVEQVAIEKSIDMKAISGVEYTLENSDITIVFDNNKVYGFSGVNRYFGGYQLEGDKITIGNVASTMMAGLPSKMEEESNYLKALAKVNKIVVEEKTLILTDGTTVLKFITK